jgi:hypothetical protein
MEPLWDRIEISPLISERFFSPDRGFGMPRFYGVLVDGDHEPGKPLEDALNAARHLSETGAIIFHDGIGAPVREAVTALIDRGLHARVYWTPHIVFCCWRGDFKPVDHIGDPAIDWTYHKAAMSKDFDFSRCE